MDYLYRWFLLWLAVLFTVGFVVAENNPCAKAYTLNWASPDDDYYSVRMTGSLVALWEPTNRTITLVVSTEGEKRYKTSSWDPGVWSASPSYITLKGPAFEGGSTIGGQPVTGGSRGFNPGQHVIQLLPGAQPEFEMRVTVLDYWNSHKHSPYNWYVDLQNWSQFAAAVPDVLTLPVNVSGVVEFEGAVIDNRDLVWLVEHVSGPVLQLAVDQENSYAQVQGSVGGISVYRVKATAAVCAPESGWATFTVHVSEGKCVSWKVPQFGADDVPRWDTSWDDGGKFALRYRARQLQPDGSYRHWEEFVPEPGKVEEYKITGVDEANTNPIELQSKTASWYYWDESKGVWGRWLVIESGDTWKTIDTKPATEQGCNTSVNLTPEQKQKITEPEIRNPIDPANPGKTNPPPASGPPREAVDKDGKKTGGSIWNTTVIEGGSLREETFVEGIGKLERQLEALNSKMGGGTDAAVTDAAAAGAAAVAEAESEGAEAAQEAGASIPTVGQPGEISISKSEPNWSITFPAVMGGKTVDLNPFRGDRFGPIIDWFRLATHWGILVMFALWASHQLKDWVKAVSQLRPAHGNALALGTGAQATAFTNAILITVVVSVFTVSLLGWLTGQFAIPALLSLLNANPTGGLAAGALWILDRVFPVGTIIAALVVRVAWNFYATSIFTVAMTTIRYFVK